MTQGQPGSRERERSQAGVDGALRRTVPAMPVALLILIFVPAIAFAVIKMRQNARAYYARQAQVTADQADAKTWRPVAGTVLTSSVISRTIGPDGNQSTLYSPLVNYQFQVGATMHTGTQLRPGDALDPSHRFSSERPEEAATIAGRYPSGAAVTVYYDPEDPATRNCLEP